MLRLKDKIVLVTGAAQGIGAAIAELFVQEGAFVILSDIQEKGRDLAQKLGEKAIYQVLDVSKESDWKNLFQFILTRFGKLDVLINNAGICFDPDFSPQDPERASLTSWRKIHSVNLEGVFLGCKYAIALMKKQGGSIVNMSSRSGMVGVPRAASYAASKAGIRNHTKSVALYCCEEGYKIRCNSIHPGAILTPLWDAMLGVDETHRKNVIAKLSKGIPLGHMGEPIDVAYLALYLASDESKYMTGAEITLDGGILAGSSATVSDFENE